MQKPDLLITQIKHADYPIWRYTLKTYRDFYGKIIVYFNENNRFPYLDHFLHDQLLPLGNIVFLDQKQIDWGREDWRNVSTNEMLKHSTNDWVCSVEQDFFTKDWVKLMTAVELSSFKADLIGYRGKQSQQSYQPYLSNDYVHPCFWFMKREALERTHKNFSAAPDRGADHFGLITQSAMDNHIPIKYLDEMGFVDFVDDFHLGGVIQNYFDMEIPERTIYRPEMFLEYNYWSMTCPVVQSPVFMDKMVRMDQRLRKEHPEIIPESGKWGEFFKL